MNSYETTWFDDFFFVVAGATGVFIYVDWLLGEERRRKMREYLAAIWVMVDDINATRIFDRWIGKLSKAYDFILGKSITSPKKWLPIIALVGSHIYVIHTHTNCSFAYVYQASAIEAVISAIVVQQVLLKCSLITHSIIKYIALLVGIVCSAYLSVVCGFFYLEKTGVFDFHVFVKPLGILLTALLFSVFALTPIILSFVLIGVFIFLRITFQLIIAPTLYALQESNKGVLTSVAIFLGAVSKLLQQYIKSHG
jgi:hypothetical protein